MQRAGVRDALVRPVAVVEVLELAQGMDQVALVPDQRPIQQLASAGLHPPLHDRLMRGIRTPLSTTSIPASRNTASNTDQTQHEDTDGTHRRRPAPPLGSGPGGVPP